MFPFLIIAYLALLIFLSFRKISWSLLIIIFSLPAYLIRFSVLGIPSTILEISIISVFVVWLIKNRTNLFKNKRKKGGLPYPFAWEIVLILLISFIAIFVGDLNNKSLGIFKAYFLEPLALFILILNNFKGQKAIKQIIMTLAFSSFLVSALALWQKFTGQFIFNDFWFNPENRRVVSFFGYPNAVALYLGPILPLLIGFFFGQLKKRGSLKLFIEQVFLIIATISGFLAIYFAKSKGALLALILVLLINIIIIIKKKWRILFLIFLIIISSSFYFLKKDWVNLKLSSSLSYQVRIKQWEETLEMLKDGRFLWGSGLAKYQSVIQPYHQDGIFFNKDADPDFNRKIIIFDDHYRAERWQPLEIYLYPHNIFLNFWVELGFLGLLVFSFLIFKFLYQSLRGYYKNKKQGKSYLYLSFFSAMLVVFLHGLVDVPYFKNDLSVLFWIIVALFSLLRIEENFKK